MDFNEIISRASTLMNNDEFNRLVEAKAGRKNINKSGGDAQIAMFEAQAFGGPISSNNMSQNQTFQPIQQNSQTTNKLPNIIRESFEKVPPINSTQMSMNSLMGGQPQQNYTPSAGIDYTIIKALIDESISRHLSEIKQNLLNESVNSLSGIKIGDGNKIVLVDKAQNVYDATLKKRVKK